MDNPVRRKRKPSTPQSRLSSFLNTLLLPGTLDCRPAANHSSGTATRVAEVSELPLWDICVGPVLQRLNAALSTAAPAIHPFDPLYPDVSGIRFLTHGPSVLASQPTAGASPAGSPPTPAGNQVSPADIAALRSTWASFSMLARDVAATQTFRGSPSVVSFIDTYLVTPVNAYLRLLVGHRGHALYWRASADHPGFHLVWERPGEPESNVQEDGGLGWNGRRPLIGRERTLAVVVVHSEEGSPQKRSRLALLSSAINNGYLYMNDSGTLVDETDDGVDTFDLVQLLSEMNKHDAHFGIITDYQTSLVCQRTHHTESGQAATSPEQGRGDPWDDGGQQLVPAVEFDGSSSAGSLSSTNALAKHPSGLLIGIALLAVAHDPDLGPTLGIAKEDTSCRVVPKHVLPPLGSWGRMGSVELSIPSPLSPADHTCAPVTRLDNGRSLVNIVHCEPVYRMVTAPKTPPPKAPPLPLHDTRGTVTLLSLLGDSGLWWAYSALLFPPGTDAPLRVVAKIAFGCSSVHLPVESEGLYSSEGEGVYSSEGEGRYSTKEAYDAAHNEDAAMRALADLQGHAVPRSYGLGEMTKPGGAGDDSDPDRIDRQFIVTLCTVMEDVGRGLHRSEQASRVTRRAIREMYRAIHARGVLHIDIEWRHIFKREDGTLALIDFDRAVVRSNEDDATWDRNCEAEMCRVDELLWDRRSV